MDIQPLPLTTQGQQLISALFNHSRNCLGSRVIGYDVDRPVSSKEVWDKGWQKKREGRRGGGGDDHRVIVLSL